jgi:hypothetical protein
MEAQIPLTDGAPFQKNGGQALSALERAFGIPGVDYKLSSGRGGNSGSSPASNSRT